MAAVPHSLDSNTLLRLAKRDDPEHALVTTAIERLIEEGAEICYTPQNVVEFWSVFTRPKEKNGFGLSVAEADREARLIETRFAFLPDNEQDPQRMAPVGCCPRSFGRASPRRPPGRGNAGPRYHPPPHVEQNRLPSLSGHYSRPS